MTLAEKIAALRAERKLSQGDLAEKLDVSRQSVSKWETGQAVPEVDKIIKLADLFGVTIDELLRDGDKPKAEDAPKPEQPPVEEPKIVYVEQKWLTPIQITGVVFLALGLLIMISGVQITGAIMMLLGLPLLLARKHPLLVAGWLVLAVSCLLLNPRISVAPWGPWQGLIYLNLYLTQPEMHHFTYLFAAIVGIIRGLLFLVLAIYTGRLCWKKWKSWKQPEQATGI